MLCYLINLEMRELRNARIGCKFKFCFWSNPYFRNQVTVKEYECRSSGRWCQLQLAFHGTRARNHLLWCTGTGRLSKASLSGSQHSLPEADRVAQIIKEDLWPNPLQYCLLGNRPHTAR